MKPPYVISLNLTNNTPMVQPISIMNPNPNNQGISGNAVQNKYSYNVHNEIANAITNSGFNYVTVIFSKNGGSYQQLTINYGSSVNSVSKLIDALNSLGQSFFYQSAVSPDEAISCYSISSSGDNYFYSSISINANFVTNSFFGKSTYGIDGTIIYNTGYATTGIGTLSRINTSNPFWINSTHNITDGSLNRAGVSSANLPNSPSFIVTGAGIFANINVSSNRTVYVGIANSAISIASLYVNNQQILSIINSAAFVNSINTQLGTSATNPLFQFWSIYPVNLFSGNNYILLNTTGQANSSSSIAFEVYDNTTAEIAAATSYAELNLLFSSKDYTGNMI